LQIGSGGWPALFLQLTFFGAARPGARQAPEYQRLHQCSKRAPVCRMGARRAAKSQVLPGSGRVFIAV
jgi:hypothetical protein